VAEWAILQIVVQLELLVIGGNTMASRCFTCMLILSLFTMSNVFVHAEDVKKTGGKDDSLAAPRVARVFQCNGPVEINRSNEHLAVPGMYLSAKDTVTIPDGTQLALVFQDGAVRQFKGPATVDFQSGSLQNQPGMLIKLAASLKELLFSEEKTQPDVQMGVRHPALPDEAVLKVPRLLAPIPGTALLRPPAQLRWQPVQGVFLYSVSMFDSNQRLWVKETKNNFIDLSSSEVGFLPGNTYLWTVEAVVGNSTLRSDPAAFKILDVKRSAQLTEVLSKIDESSVDDLMSQTLKLHVYGDLNLKDECYRQAELILENRPGDYTAQMIKAQLLEEMGLYDQALEIYKAVLVR
jgi:hypothetical protein